MDCNPLFNKRKHNEGRSITVIRVQHINLVAADRGVPYVRTPKESLGKL